MSVILMVSVGKRILKDHERTVVAYVLGMVKRMVASPSGQRNYSKQTPIEVVVTMDAKALVQPPKTPIHEHNAVRSITEQ